MSIRGNLEILNLANKKIANEYSDPDKESNEKNEFVVIAEPDSIEALSDINEIVPDGDTWDISANEKKLIKKIKENSKMNDEEKILSIYNYICEKYTYDDNLNYYITKDDNENYGVGDWYGRVPSEEWKENRKGHNKRVCFELARILAKSMKELFKDNDNYDECILWDKKNIHYFVGLKGRDYTVILDPDNFNQIKDLTRTKLGLTATGIKILEDKNGLFTSALDQYNSNKPEKIPEIEELDKNISDEEYIKKSLDILKEKDIDSHGYYEVAKKIIKGRGIPTKNLWKFENNKRYERCLFFIMPEDKRKVPNELKDEESKICIVDSQKKELKKIDDIDQIDRRIYITRRGAGPVNTYKGELDEER